MQDEEAHNNLEDAAGTLPVDPRSVNLSESNALILEKVHRGEHDKLTIISVHNDDFDLYYSGYFVVTDGDNLQYLGHVIKKSTSLKTLTLDGKMPLNDSFRDGLAGNKSIQVLEIIRDLGEEGFRNLAGLFQNTNSLQKLSLFQLNWYWSNIISLESMKSFTSLLRQRQIPSLKTIYSECNQWDVNECFELCRALSMQPQLERLDIHESYFGDEEIVAFVEGMANFTDLEVLRFTHADEDITEVGLRALSSLFRSNKCLREIYLICMHIHDDDMTVLAPGLASLKSLKRLEMCGNYIGDEGLKALAAARPKFYHLEKLDLSDNNYIGDEGLKALSSVLQTASRLKVLNLDSNSIEDEGLHAFLTAMKDQCTIEDLDLSRNAISFGVRSLAGMGSLRRLRLYETNIGNSVEAMGALAESMESLRNLEKLVLNNVTSSGLSIFAPVFQSESFNLQELDLDGIRIDDSGAVALANGLKGNKSLKIVTFRYPWRTDVLTDVLTDVGLSAFERLLCDTSCVNNTYCSNHTLEQIWGIHYRHSSIKTLLDLNKKKDSKGCNVPICKILASHSDIDMTPLLQWGMKLLPFVVAWFERAQSTQRHWIHPMIAFEGRKLSAVYQFVGGFSHAVVNGYIRSIGKTRRVTSVINQDDDE